MSYSLPFLNFESLNPVFTREMIDFHYNGHHATYVKNLNQLLADHNIQNTESLSAEQFIQTIDTINISNEIKQKIKFNYGGYWNHKFFWEHLTHSGSVDNNISDAMKNLICDNFSSLDEFFAAFKQKALGIMGSGWCWLCANKFNPKKLTIIPTCNQDLVQLLNSKNNEKFMPILTLDMWEHAYYLQYKNKKADFIDEFWQIVNWTTVEKNIRECE